MIKPDKVLGTWLKAVNEKRINKIISLYDKNAVLIPTFSNMILNTPDRILNYFEQLGRREKLRIKLHKNSVNSQQVSGKIFSVCGIYTWQFLVENELLTFEARFSFILNLNSERPIVHHHSSQVPRML